MSEEAYRCRRPDRSTLAWHVNHAVQRQERTLREMEETRSWVLRNRPQWAGVIAEMDNTVESARLALRDAKTVARTLEHDSTPWTAEAVS